MALLTTGLQAWCDYYRIQEDGSIDHCSATAQTFKNNYAAALRDIEKFGWTTYRTYILCPAHKDAWPIPVRAPHDTEHG